MAKQNVLFLTCNYPPQKSPRSIQISHVAQAIRGEIYLKIVTFKCNSGDDSLLSFTPLDNVEYANKSFISRFIETSRGSRIKESILPDQFYFWHFDLYKKAMELIKSGKVDTIVTFGQPMSSHIAGLKLKKSFPNLKWIAHFSDPWVDNPFNKYNWWLWLVNSCYQAKVLKLADRLIFTSEETVNLVNRNSSLNILDKSSVIPHSFNDELYDKNIKNKSEKSRLIIRYVGNFYGDRQPDKLLNALLLISKDTLERFRLEFFGSCTKDFSENIKRHNLENTVSINNPVSYLESLTIMQESDLLLVIDAPAESSPFLPSKLIDYIGANRPIFGITPNGTSRKLLEKMGFTCVDSSNEKDIADRLCEVLCALKSENYPQVPRAIRDEYLSKNISKRLLEILHQTTFL